MGLNVRRKYYIRTWASSSEEKVLIRTWNMGLSSEEKVLYFQNMEHGPKSEEKVLYKNMGLYKNNMVT